MYVLILTLFMTTTTPGAMTSAQFSSEQTCLKAASAWNMQARLILGNVKLSTVCMPK